MALGAFGIINTEFGVIGLLPALSRDLGITIDTAGWLLSSFALTIAIAGPFAVMFTSQINRKTMMCLVLLLFVISNLVSAFSTGFMMLMVARIIPAIIHPVFWAVAIVAAAKQENQKDSTKAVAIITGGISTATVIGVPLAAYIANSWGWRYAFGAQALVNLIALTGLIAWVPSMPAEKKSILKTQLLIFKNKALWIVLFTALFMVAGMFSTYGYLAAYLVTLSHLNGGEVSLMLLLFGGMGIIGNWLTGIALTRNMMITTRFFLLALAGAHLLAYWFGDRLVPLVIITSVWGLIHTGGFLINQIRTTRAAPEAAELASSLNISFSNAGVALGAFLGGLVIAAVGIQQVIWVSIAFLLAAFLLSFAGKGRTIRLLI